MCKWLCKIGLHSWDEGPAELLITVAERFDTCRRCGIRSRYLMHPRGNFRRFDVDEVLKDRAREPDPDRWTRNESHDRWVDSYLRGVNDIAGVNR